MNNVTFQGNTAYHFDRYAPGGLFKGEDPANLTLASQPYSLKQRFTPLNNERNALVITAKVKT